MSYLLDTNTCIRYLNGQSAAVRARLQKISPNEVKLCSVVKAELLYGAAKSTSAKRTHDRLHQFFNLFESHSFDDSAAVKYSSIRADLERRGTPIGPNDLLIASIALATDSVLVTHNTREFGRIAELKVEDWEEPQALGGGGGN